MQKSELKGSQGLATCLESAMHRLSGDIILIAILTLFRPKLKPRTLPVNVYRLVVLEQLLKTIDYLATQHLHNAFNSQKITGTMKLFLIALQSRPTSSGYTSSDVEN